MINLDVLKLNEQNRIGGLTMEEINNSYGFDIVTAKESEIKHRAMKLCDEYAEKYSEPFGDNIKMQTFEALKRMWECT